jgi:hypothetical protein
MNDFNFYKAISDLKIKNSSNANSTDYNAELITHHVDINKHQLNKSNYKIDLHVLGDNYLIQSLKFPKLVKYFKLYKDGNLLFKCDTFVKNKDDKSSLLSKEFYFDYPLINSFFDIVVRFKTKKNSLRNKIIKKYRNPLLNILKKEIIIDDNDFHNVVNKEITNKDILLCGIEEGFDITYLKIDENEYLENIVNNNFEYQTNGINVKIYFGHSFIVSNDFQNIILESETEYKTIFYSHSKMETELESFESINSNSIWKKVYPKKYFVDDNENKGGDNFEYLYNFYFSDDYNNITNITFIPGYSKPLNIQEISFFGLNVTVNENEIQLPFLQDSQNNKITLPIKYLHRMDTSISIFSTDNLPPLFFECIRDTEESICNNFRKVDAQLNKLNLKIQNGAIYPLIDQI